MNKPELEVRRTATASQRRGVEIFAVLFIAIVALSCIRQQVDVFAVCSDSRSIYTVDPSNPTARCITVHGSRIAGVGSIGAFLS